MGQLLKINQTGRLFFEFDSRPTSALLTIVQSDGSSLPTAVTDEDISAGFTEPDIATTLDADAAKGDVTLTLTSVDDILPEYDYWLDGGTRLAEQVRVKSVDGAAKTVELYLPLAGQHLDGATFERNVLAYDVDAENNDELYTDNVATVTVERLIDNAEAEESVDFLYSVRYTKFKSTLTVSRLLAEDSNMSNWGGQRSRGLEQEMLAGLLELQAYLAEHNYDINNLKDCSRAEMAHCKATIYKIITNWARGNAERQLEVDRARADFERAAQNLIHSGAWYESTQDGIKDESEETADYDRDALIWA
jgi:hypothetical protein